MYSVCVCVCVCVYKQDLALNSSQGLIYYKNTNQPFIWDNHPKKNTCMFAYFYICEKISNKNWVLRLLYYKHVIKMKNEDSISLFFTACTLVFPPFCCLLEYADCIPFRVIRPTQQVCSGHDTKLYQVIVLQFSSTEECGVITSLSGITC